MCLEREEFCFTHHWVIGFVTSSLDQR